MTQIIMGINAMEYIPSISIAIFLTAFLFFLLVKFYIEDCIDEGLANDSESKSILDRDESRKNRKR